MEIKHEDKRTLVWAIYALSRHEITKQEFEERSIKCIDETIELGEALPIDNVSKCECGETKDLITVCENCTYKMVSEGN